MPLACRLHDAEAGWDPEGPFSGSGGEGAGEAGMKRRMLAMMLEGGCRQPNEVLAAAKRMLADGEVPPGPLLLLRAGSLALPGGLKRTPALRTPLPLLYHAVLCVAQA